MYIGYHKKVYIFVEYEHMGERLQNNNKNFVCGKRAASLIK